MKTHRLIHIATVLAVLAAVQTVTAQGTVFSYTGRLAESGGPANGSYDFRFRLAADALGNTYIGAPYLIDAVPVAAGAFSVQVDFGAGAFTGSNYWLQVDVRPNGGSSYTTLTPLQRLGAVPYALMAHSASNLLGTLPASQLTGTLPPGQFSGIYTAGVALNNAANSFTGNGAGLTALNASSLGSGTIPDARLAGTYSSAVSLNNPANNFTGNGGGLTSLNASSLGSGTVPSARLSGTYSSALTLNNAANNFSGSGGGLTALNASQLNSGTVPDARLSANAALLNRTPQIFSGTNVFDSRVGIGTASPAATLDVAGSTIIRGQVSPSGTSMSNLLNLGSGATADGFRNGISFYEGAAAPAMMLGYDGTVSGTANNALRMYDSTGLTRFTFEHGGNLGVGETNPYVRLVVSGSGSYNSSTAAGLVLDNTSANGKRWEWHAMDGGSLQLAEFDSAQTRIVVTTNGQVGLGVNNPQSGLEVNGDVKLGGGAQLFAPAGEENLRMIRGSVTKTGAITAGSGFTCTRVSDGHFRITFNTQFTGAPTVTVTTHQGWSIGNLSCTMIAGSTACKTLASLVSVSTSTFEVSTWNASEPEWSSVNVDFDFIVVGPR